MWHHSEAPGRAGVDYDVLWWTDHMDRTTAKAFPQELDFNDGTLSGEFSFGTMRMANTDPDTTDLRVKGGVDKFARITHTNPGGAEWSAGGAIYIPKGNLHRISLMADPEIRMDLRLLNVPDPSDVSVVVRVTLSSRRGPGNNDTGAPNYVEYCNTGLPIPDLEKNHLHQTVSIPAFDVRGSGFTPIVLRPLRESNAHFYEKGDQTIYEIEILAASRNGREVELEMDNFELSVDPLLADKNLLVAAEDLVQSDFAPYNLLTQHVGMEIAGPKNQKVTEFSTRDHVIALYRDSIRNSISGLYDFFDPELFTNWPQRGVDLIHADNGVAVIAHMFSPKIPPGVLSDDSIRYLSERVLENRAWGADAIEIGYELRGAPLETYVDVWDKLSAQRVYITGVGVSDHHNPKDWELRVNRMGTWIRATSDGPAELANAIQSGHAYFGDPYRFDSISGDLDFRISGTSTTMGDVLPLSESNSIRFKADVVGAVPGDNLVWLHNGRVIDRHHLNSVARTAFKQILVQPGDWVRVELRTPEEKIYLLSNPIYFCAYGDPIPAHRSP